MGVDSAHQFTPDFAVRPGDTLLEVLEALELSQSDLAERTGRPKKTINEIVNGKSAITPETALQFERVLGIPASFWNTLEQRYRASLARIAEREVLKAQSGWLAKFPVKALVKYGWIPARNTAAEQLETVLSFFGVASVDAWEEVWSDVRRRIAFNHSSTFESDFGAVTAWVRRGELQARQIQASPYDAAGFRALLKEIRRLSRLSPEDFAPRLIAMCAEVGVVVTFVPALPKLPVCGAMRWLSGNKAMMLLTLRYKTNDHLWFTILHEAGHILLHGKRAVFVEKPSTLSATSAPTDHGDRVAYERALAEVEANRFARDVLIPQAAYAEFRRRGSFSADAIRAFAEQMEIAPGIVLGRLQHDKVLPYPTRLNKMLKEHFELRSPTEIQRGATTPC